VGACFQQCVDTEQSAQTARVCPELSKDWLGARAIGLSVPSTERSINSPAIIMSLSSPASLPGVSRWVEPPNTLRTPAASDFAPSITTRRRPLSEARGETS
jgi:hypothetical protein